VLPALERGAVVITDRYLDSSVAYQGAGRDLEGPDVARLSRWATEGLTPDLTVLLDLPAEAGLARVEQPDRVESEPHAFHERVRDRFLEQARLGGARYLVLDGTEAPTQIASEIRARLEPLLPMTRREHEEIEARRRAEEEQRAQQEAAAAEERARRAAADAAERERLAAVRRAEEQARRAAEETAREQARAEKERRRIAEHEERERRRAAVEAERAAAAAERARRAMEDAEERRRTAETRAGATAGPNAGASAGSSADSSAGVESGGRAPVDPPTRPMSLADELFGGDDPDETIHMPRVNDPRDRP
jgi:dTMP kinase